MNFDSQMLTKTTKLATQISGTVLTVKIWNNKDFTAIDYMPFAVTRISGSNVLQVYKAAQMLVNLDCAMTSDEDLMTVTCCPFLINSYFYDFLPNYNLLDRTVVGNHPIPEVLGLGKPVNVMAVDQETLIIKY